MASDDNEKPESEGAAKAERSEGSSKKERVLHTRVPAVLEEELKRLATSLKMPVSNLVRAVLEDAVDAVDFATERAEGELKGIASRIHAQRESLRSAVQTGSATASAAEASLREKESAAMASSPSEVACPASSPDLEGVLGVQRLTLISESKCSVCGRVLARGSEACRGVRDDAGPKVLLGGRCSLLPEGA